MNKIYSKQEKEIVKKLSEKGCTIDEILSVLIQRTQESIRRYCRIKNITLKGKEPEINIDRFEQLMKGK